MPQPALEVSSLEYHYGSIKALVGITLSAMPGEIVGLLGPNGAGKTTALSCIAGLRKPRAGTIRIDGLDLQRDGPRAKAALGIVPQELALYEDLSARDNLRFWAAAYGLSGRSLARRVEEVLVAVGLQDRSVERVARFSVGMKRRLNFGCGLVHRPRLLLLDEPTVAVDPQSRARLLELVRAEVDSGACVLYASHDLGEAQDLCDRIAIVDRGELIADGTLDELRSQVGEKDVIRVAGRFDVSALRCALEGIEGAEVVDVEDDHAVIRLTDAARRLPELLEGLKTAGEIRETTIRRASLETLFLSLTGRALRD